MGNEFLGLFIPVIPILFVFSAWRMFRYRTRKELALLMLVIFTLILVLTGNSWLQGFAVYGFIVTICYVPYSFIAWMVSGIEKKIQSSQWKKRHDKET